MDWHSEARSINMDLLDFEFSDRSRLAVRLAGKTLGDSANASTDAVVLLHGTTGSSDQYLQPEFADALFGPGKPLDIDRHFIILPDALGHGMSSKPSDAPIAPFPRYGYQDMVTAQHRFVTEAIGVSHLRLVMGASMGGMQTWMWGALYHGMMDGLIAVASVPERISGRNLLFRRLLVDLVRGDLDREGASPRPGRGLAAAWSLFQLMAESPAHLAQILPDIDAADSFIQDLSKKSHSQHPLDVIAEFDASWDYDPAPLLPHITAPLLAINFVDDAINPTELGGIDRAIKMVATGKAITLPVIAGSRGHQNLRRPELWGEWIQSFLHAITS